MQIESDIQADLMRLGLDHLGTFMQFCDGEMMEYAARRKKTEVLRFKLSQRTVYLKRTLGKLSKTFNCRLFKRVRYQAEKLFVKKQLRSLMV
ncbi:MAG: hypothetical protein HY559_01760 [Gammaproteobacteria bacterium]|nr:hypothetical protein [Gammaproteobacteria bacterium]